MEQKTKFIIIGLIGFSVVCLFLFMQATNQQQTLLRESNDLKSQNTTLLSKVNQLENDLRGNQNKIDSLQREKSVLETDINSLRSEKKDLLEQLDHNQKLLDSLSQEVARVKNDKAGMKMLKDENDVLIRQLKSLSSRKMILDQKVQSLQEAKSTLEKRLNEMNTMLTDRASLHDSLKRESDTPLKSGSPAVVLDKKRDSVELPAIIVRSSPSSQKPEAQVFSGKILAVNADNNFVIIDLGASSGVKIGDTFNVYRAQKSIGSLAVIQIRDNISACDIKRTSAPLKIGDNIK